MGRRNEVEYDVRGQLVKATSADGISEVDYDARGFFRSQEEPIYFRSSSQCPKVCEVTREAVCRQDSLNRRCRNV